MIKQTLTAAALAAALATPAFAQQGTPMSPPNSSAGAMDNVRPSTGAKQAGFLQSQNQDEWRGSKLIGAKVYGPDNKSIGEIDDVIFAGNGQIKAAVVGVGGFLGVGEKDVALPFEALHITRKPDSASIEKITVSYSKDELKNAPAFAYYQASNAQTTGSSVTDKLKGMNPMSGSKSDK